MLSTDCHALVVIFWGDSSKISTGTDFLSLQIKTGHVIQKQQQQKKIFFHGWKKLSKFEICLGKEPQTNASLEMSVEMFVNLPFRKRQFWNKKCHSKIKIKVDIKWNVKTEWVNISKISHFLNSPQLKLFSKCKMKAISSSFYPNWRHATFIIWSHYLPAILTTTVFAFPWGRRFTKPLLPVLR